MTPIAAIFLSRLAPIPGITVPALVTVAMLMPVFPTSLSAADTEGHLDIYFIDVEGGACTLLVAPSGESLVIDSGYPDNNGRDRDRLLQQGYRGSRYSFGYPACPNLEDQEQILELLGAGRIGLTLRDG